MSRPRRPSPTAPPETLSDVGALRAFVAVARTGAVGRAALALGRTQPSVSSRVAALERTWSTRLFRRVARGMTLTPEGARLLPLAEAALHGIEELDRAAGRPLAALRELRVGAGDALGRGRMPQALSRLLHEQPEVEVHLREGPGPALIEALRAGEIDLALIVPAPGTVAVEGVDLEPWLESEVVLLEPVGSAGPAERPVPLRALAERRQVGLQPGSGFRRLLDGAFAAAGLVYRPAIEVGNLSLVRRFVAAGLGVAPVPAIAFEGLDPDRGVRRRRLSGVGRIVYHRAVRGGLAPSHLAARLLELLRD